MQRDRDRNWRQARGLGRKNRPPDLGVGPVPHDTGHLGHERGHRHGGQRRRDHGHRDPNRHHPLYARHGCLHDHRREDRADHRAQTRLHDRLHRLRVRIGNHRTGQIPPCAHSRVVGARGIGRSVDHARGGRAGCHELRAVRATKSLRSRGIGGRRRRGSGPVGRWAVHDLRQLALGLLRRGHHCAWHPRPHEADGGLARGSRSAP
jgi:hypothetical protein